MASSKGILYSSLTLIGPDRKGIIARFTQLFFQLGANIEGLEEQVARGRFSMTVLASWDKKKVNPEAARAVLLREAEAVHMEATLRFETPGEPKMAILVTKEPHILEGLLAATGLGKTKGKKTKKTLPCRPVVVIGNRPDLEPLAKKAGLPFHLVDYKDRAKAEAEIRRLLDSYGAQFLVLARFMKILSPDFVWRWKNKIINIHPSLLPAFPGANAYRQAFEKGVKVFGVTAHFATPQLDEGPILAQEAATVGIGEPLSEIVRKGQLLETKCLLAGVKLFLTRKLDIYWGRVHSAE
ncbi:formyltetrahydrofolate deformylase [Verrucomicrobium sp. GAS474]|uniref:formyltetrahydrofolate deformylase n=1 Tax=Verrucomicrobium sp. GAS474 TaxID=1882831 RepID=UPI00087D75A4|nr:formyltransferase family protein [Verrucomicrobium sp. GAS474]SDT89257.1 formyltetrahydrofolate deformylase [Verrucomicrobium sp. GAS474]